MLPDTEIQAGRTPVTFGAFTFDRSSRLLRRGAEEVALPPRVLGVLEILLARAGDVVSRQELIDKVWNEAFVTDTSLAEAVSFLRQSLGDDPQAPTYIQTIHRRGYRFVAPIVEGAGPSRAARHLAPDAGIAAARVRPSIGGDLVPWTAAVLCALLAAAAVWQLTHVRAPVRPVVRVGLDPAPGTTFDRRVPAIALSPDGTAAVWAGCDGTGCRLYVREVDRLDARPIAGTDDGAAPFFSPDGRWIGFFAGGKIKKVARGGGLPIPLADAAQPFGAAWLDDGRIVFAASAHGGLLRVGDTGGVAEPMTVPSASAGELRHSWPATIPGQRALLFSIATSPVDGALGRIAVMPLDGVGSGRAWRIVMDAADVARAVAPDYVAFSRGGELHAAAFDGTRQTLASADVVASDAPLAGIFGVGGGALGYIERSTPGTATLEWLAGGGPPIAATAAALREPSLSPDAQRIAGLEGDPAGSDIRVADVARGATTRLTHGGINVAPVWSRDSSMVFYAASSGGAFEVWSRDATGVAPARKVLSAARRQRHLLPASVSQDGQLLAYDESGGSTRGDIGILAVAAGTAQTIVETPFDEMRGMLSPDGKTIAYQSDESGRWEIYLMRLADRRRFSISTGGGTSPFWSADGRTLFYRGADRLASVAIEQNGDRVGPAVLSAPLDGGVPSGITPDGRILLRRDSAGARNHAVLTLEWVRDLRRILGPPATTLPR